MTVRITTIELAGTSKTKLRDGTPGLPRAFAKMSRKLGDKYIHVEVFVADSGDHGHFVQADDRDDQWSMAEILQHALDGYEGTNGDIDGYFRAIQMLAD